MRILYSLLVLLFICNPSYAKRLDEMNANTSPDITNDLIYSQDVSDTSENSHGTGKSLTIKNLLKATKINVDGTNVGINTITPTQQLEVIGTVKATSFIGDGSALTGVGGSSSISDTAYGVGWDGDTTTGASKNALYDKIETLGSASISDAVYGAGWDGDTSTAPSKNAVYDKIETIGSTSGGWTDGGSNVYATATSDNVAIGTTIPSYKLEVKGPIGLNGEGVNNALNFAGLWKQFSSQPIGPGGSNFDYLWMRPTTTNASMRLGLMSNGTVSGTAHSMIAGIKIFSTSDIDDLQNSCDVGMYMTSSGFRINTKHNGTCPSFPLHFGHQDTIIDMTLTNSGNLGIGTITPSQKLQVVGTVVATAFIGDGSALTGITGGGGLGNVVEDTTPQLGGDLDMNGNSIDFPSTPNISDVLDEDNMASNSATKLATQQSIKAYVDTAISGVSGGASGWTDGGTNIYNTTTTDNVGIGTTIPSSSLMIRSSTSTGLKIVNSAGGASGGAGIQAISDDNAAAVQGDRLGFYTFGGSADTADTINNGAAISGYAEGTYSSSSAPSELRFETAPAGSTTRSVRMYVKSDGTVGIGTANPQSTLQVAGDTKVGNGSFSNTSASEDLYVEGNLEVDGTLYGNGSGLTGITSGGWTDGGTKIYPTLTSDQVAIGTTTPISGASLTVLGTLAGAGTGPIAFTNANVGIGTTTAGALLTVGSTGQATIDSSGIIQPAGYKSADGTTGATVTTCTGFKNGLCISGT